MLHAIRYRPDGAAPVQGFGLKTAHGYWLLILSASGFAGRTQTGRQAVASRTNHLSREFLVGENFDPDNLAHVLIALSHEYLTYMHRLDDLDALTMERVQEIESYVGHLFETLSDEEYTVCALHFRVFYSLKYQNRHMTDEPADFQH